MTMARDNENQARREPMAQDDRGSSAHLPIAGVLALILFASGLIVQHQPLESVRPGSIGKQDKPARDLQIVEARLWQDPFDAVQRWEQERKTERPEDPSDGKGLHSVAAFRHEVLQRSPEKTLVLPVMVYGGPYAEDVESRRRARYAVLSALRASDYEPVNSRAVGFVRLDNSGPALHGMHVPFELWKRMKAPPPAPTLDPQALPVANGERAWEEVLVLWLQEEWFSQTSGDLIGTLFDRLVPYHGRTNAAPIVVIGPSSPSTAEGLHEDPKLEPCSQDRIRIRNRCVLFISPGLTAPALTESPRIVRMSPSDDKIAAAIIDELALRRVVIPSSTAPKTRCDDHVALIVESDTSHGRSLERQFRQQLADCKPDAGREERRLHIFRYFRGLDGRVAAAHDSGKKSTDSGSSEKREKQIPPDERAQGDGQFDYLLRVAASLEQKDEEIGRGERQRIRAVVVLGADIHDKLAVFHALREKLPQAVFATHDLDAALLERDRLNWTRNAIVVSGYGLSLRSTLRAGAAPFRDSHQSATFLAARYAIAPPDHRLRDLLKAAEEYREQVRVFEIGNTGAIRLDSQRRIDDNFELWLWALGALALSGFGSTHSWCAGPNARRRGKYLVVAVLILFAYWLLAREIAQLPGEEPLYWLRGISAWPGDFIRMGAILLATYGGFRIHQKLLKADDALEKEFFSKPGEEPREDEKTARLEERLQGTWRKQFERARTGFRNCFPKASAVAGPHQDEVDVYKLWRLYRVTTSPAAVIPRVALSFTFLAAFTVIVLAGLERPIPPVRGELSSRIDFVTTTFSIVTAGLLIAYVLDRVASATFFLRGLYGEHYKARSSRWEEAGSGIMERLCGFSLPDKDRGTAALAVRSYVDLRLSAQLTAYVGRIVFYPFFLVLLLIFARSRFFDNWAMPIGLFVVCAFGLSLITFAALALRASAERIRRYTVAHLATVEIAGRTEHKERKDAVTIEIPPCVKHAEELRRAQTPVSGPTPEQLRLMRETATNLREGAFAPISEQPIMRALLLPFGGAGLVGLLEWAMFVKW
jgi:hypothetical protein